MAGTVKRFDRLRNIVDKNEAKYAAQLKANYTAAYKKIKREAQVLSSKMKTGVFTRTEMYKAGRYKKLMKVIQSELAAVNKKAAVMDYVAGQYQFSHLYTGYIMETEYPVRLGIQALKKKEILAAIQNDYSKIALKNNKALAVQNIRKAVAQTIIRGEGINEMAAAIRQGMEKNLNNTFRIARTETTRAMNAAQEAVILDTAEIIPIEKGWLATLDDATRDEHRDIDGEYVTPDKPFSNRLMYPGDPSGSAEEVINCRCTMTTRLVGDKSPGGVRAARAEGGQTELTPDTTYKEWVAKPKG